MPQLSLLANYFAPEDVLFCFFCPGVSGFVLRRVSTSVISQRESRSQTVLSTGGFVLSQQLGGMTAIRRESLTNRSRGSLQTKEKRGEAGGSGGGKGVCVRLCVCGGGSGGGIQETPDHTACKFRPMSKLYLLCFFCPDEFCHD